MTVAHLPVVDSNGAGNGYMAAFLATMLRGGIYGKAAIAGSIARAYACGSAGTHTGFIDRDGLAQAIAAQGP